MVENGISNIKAMSKSELAQKYGIHKETLRKWIIGNKELMKELREIGYNKNRNLLSPKELQLISEYLGF